MLKHFLLCSERSGSNLITKLLDAHSQICGPSTKHLMNPMFRNLFRYEPLGYQENWNKLIKDLLNLFDVEFSVWKSKFTFNELQNEVQVGDYLGLINYFFEKEAKENNKSILFIKENHIYEFFPYLNKFYPTSKFLYQVRDPRDVALSWKKNPTHKGGVVNAALQWKNDQQQLLKLSHLLKEDNRVITLKYEELIANTPKELERILVFFDLQYETKVLDFYKDSITKENATTQHAWNNLSKRVMQDNSNKFKKELSEEEVLVIEKICYNEMMFLGYQPINEERKISSITEDKILDLKFKEELIEYNPSKGVTNNMKAKSTFYQNLPILSS